MRAGPRRRRLDILRRQTGAPNALNERVEVWTPIAIAWAERHDLSDGERRAVGTDLSARQARFTVRATPVLRTVTADDRLRFSGDATQWDILGVKDANMGRGEALEITAERRSDMEGPAE